MCIRDRGVALNIILQLFGLKSCTNWANLLESGSSKCANIFFVNVAVIWAWFASFITILLLLVFILLFAVVMLPFCRNFSAVETCIYFSYKVVYLLIAA